MSGRRRYSLSASLDISRVDLTLSRQQEPQTQPCSHSFVIVCSSSRRRNSSSSSASLDISRAALHAFSTNGNSRSSDTRSFTLSCLAAVATASAQVLISVVSTSRFLDNKSRSRSRAHTRSLSCAAATAQVLISVVRPCTHSRRSCRSSELPSRSTVTKQSTNCESEVTRTEDTSITIVLTPSGEIPEVDMGDMVHCNAAHRLEKQVQVKCISRASHSIKRID